ncbi:hypothetical protein QP933_06765 [Corynebacterium pseudodiphtheriticum]|uniref:hypothetical protein n=1 Tax=Corynebacterium pseudodiphtheriticum TaxID=37637 RepID=UPI00254EE132|nr:hypothetical protein [Corynebacterium pseudodiphtheriticum]MDK8500640.1 hypothetical protein [Corynebacterium pseudodiphtheriticum]MDK8775801.1 hypothetical protein [Corynebacterium pseudodiphtheriticum]
MSMPYFVATAPKVTVLRSLASTAFGVRKVDYPEGVDAPELDHESHEPGYVAALQGKRVGGFARRFIRADVSIVADGGDKAPFSDVERVLDDAAKRTSGEFFLETEVASSGLGPWIPFVDFQVGDLARVEVFGTPVVLPVTRIAPGVDDSGHESWTVHLGGQLVSDEQSRLAESEQIRRNVDESWRELANVKAEAAKAHARAEQAEKRAVEEADSAKAHARGLVDAESSARVSAVESVRREAAEDLAAQRESWQRALELEERARESGLTAEQQARFEAFEREQQAREREVQAAREDASNAVAAEERKRKQALESGLSAVQAAREEALREEQQARQQALESGLSAEQQAREEALRVTREQWQEKLRLERIAREEGITAEQVARREALEAEQAARREGFKDAERAREFIKNEVNQQRTSADERFKELRAFLTGAGKDQSDLVVALEGLNQQLRRNGAEPAPGLIPAYMQLNTELWEMQTKLNEALRQADEALKKGQEANTTAIELNRRVGEQNARISRVNREMSETNAEVAQTNRELIQVQQAIAEMNRARIAQIEHDNAQRDKLFAQLQQQERATKAQRMRVFSLGSGSDSHWSYSSSNGRLVAKGSWRGDVQAVTTVNRQDSRGNRHNMLEAWEEQVPKRGGSRTYQVEVADGNGLVWYHVQPGQSRVISMDRANFTPNYASWHQVDAFNVQSTGTHNFQARVVWDAVHRGANYQLRVSVDNRVVISDSSGTSWGPMWPWENGVRSQEAPLTSLDLRAGQRVKFEVYSDAQKSSSRVIQSAVCKAHWIDD